MPPPHATLRGPLGLIAKALAVSCVLLAGCAAHPKAPVASPEAYDWTDYKGTYAPGGDNGASAKAEEAARKKSDGKKADDGRSPASATSSAKADKADKPDAKADARPDAKPGSDASLRSEMLGAPVSSGAASASKSKASKAMIRGESVSSVSVDAVAGASKTVLKGKVVSSNVVVGQEYEQIQVVMKGVALQIVRPAATPDPSGPKVRSPKVRKASLLKTESGWYDEEANVLVLVKAGKKASSQKALAAILGR